MAWLGACGVATERCGRAGRVLLLMLHMCDRVRKRNDSPFRGGAIDGEVDHIDGSLLEQEVR